MVGEIGFEPTKPKRQIYSLLVLAIAPALPKIYYAADNDNQSP